MAETYPPSHLSQLQKALEDALESTPFYARWKAKDPGPQKPPLERFRSLQERGLPLIGMRIGILTGPVTAGSLGTEQRMEYNVHGDTVNTGARLESFQREHFSPDYLHTPCRILVGEPTLRLLGERFHSAFLGDFQLKGKVKPLRIHRIHGRNGVAAREAGEVNTAQPSSAARR